MKYNEYVNRLTKANMKFLLQKDKNCTTYHHYKKKKNSSNGKKSAFLEFDDDVIDETQTFEIDCLENELICYKKYQ